MKSVCKANPIPGSASRIRTITSSALAVSLICASAQFSIPVPWLPVPVTMQTLMIMLVSLVYGKQSVMIVAAYLGLGAIGFPVFANMKAGAAILFGPTGGFLFGFLAYALLLGTCIEKSQKPPFVFLVLVASNLLLYLIGFTWLSMHQGLAFEKILPLALLYLPGDCLKVLFVFLNYPNVLRLFRYRQV